MTRVLLDTHLILWAAGPAERLPPAVRNIMASSDHELLFSVSSIWEVAIKQALRKQNFEVDPAQLRHGLLTHGYTELPVLGPHAVAVATLPPIHRDPFDRILVAQAIVEGVELLTVDRQLSRYPGPIRCF